MSHNRLTKKEKTEEIASYIYRCFSTWKESSFYELSELNKQGWLQYAEEILEIVEKK